MTSSWLPMQSSAIIKRRKRAAGSRLAASCISNKMSVIRVASGFEKSAEFVCGGEEMQTQSRTCPAASGGKMAETGVQQTVSLESVGRRMLKLME